MAEKNNKIPVSIRALTQRINRKLNKNGEKLFKSRRTDLKNLGEYHVVDLNEKVVKNFDVNIEMLGREIAALAEWEVLED
ncbi:MAG: hypothetical protein C4548_12490 [Desulfobacteraceae bacterium]|jgi:hypothetical protein|nr:MAG: hypothetical protein C4548_12490 [Desulfobacteraceae bacterium]